jgi:hypothetical protein
MSEEFKPGLYRHYKGGLYTAICLVTHHETRKPMVLYVSHTYGGMNVRPLSGSHGDPDGWADTMDTALLDTDLARGEIVQRFQYIGPLPSNIPIGERGQ